MAVISTKSRPTVQEVIDNHTSMLDVIPKNYGLIETAQEALSAARPEQNVTLRLHIIWDNEVHNLDLERVLDLMRSTGAATVVKVEAL